MLYHAKIICNYNLIIFFKVGFRDLTPRFPLPLPKSRV